MDWSSKFEDKTVSEVRETVRTFGSNSHILISAAGPTAVLDKRKNRPL